VYVGGIQKVIHLSLVVGVLIVVEGAVVAFINLFPSLHSSSSDSNNVSGSTTGGRGRGGVALTVVIVLVNGGEVAGVLAMHGGSDSDSSSGWSCSS